MCHSPARFFFSSRRRHTRFLPVPWARSTYSSGAIIIKEEAFERMKIDPEYEEYVLNRVRSACSVQGITGCSNYVGYDVIGASPEECYGYAGPVGGSGSNFAGNENHGGKNAMRGWKN